MTLKKQNFKGDFTIVERFREPADPGQTGMQIPVPQHVRIEYCTKEHSGIFVVERDGDQCTNCTISKDGMSLISKVALSKRQIGCGPLYHTVIEIIPDETFPRGLREIPTPGCTDIELWRGKSDNSPEIISETIMQTFMYGYSAYELAKMNGFEGTEEQFALNWLNSTQQYIELAKLVSTKANAEKVEANLQLIANEQKRAAIAENAIKESISSLEESAVRAVQINTEGEVLLVKGDASPLKEGFVADDGAIVLTFNY